MSGLIWAALGKGISDFGTAYGNALMRDADAKEAEDRASARDEALIRREEERERRKEELVKRQAEEDARASIAASDAAPGVKAKRELTQLAQGRETTDEDLETVRNLNPEARKIYEESGYLTKQDARLERANDTITAAREQGASSRLLKELMTERDSVLKQIAEENKEANSVRRSEDVRATLEARIAEGDKNRATQIELLNRRIEGLVRAASVRGSGGDSKPVKMTDVQKAQDRALEKEVDALTRDISKLETKLADSLRPNEKIALQKQIEDKQARLDDVKQKREDFLSSVDGSTKPSSNKPSGGQSKPSASLPAPQSESEFDALPKDSLFKAKDGTIRIKE